MISDFLTVIMTADTVKLYLKNSEEKPRLLYSAKLQFKCKGLIKTFLRQATT